MELRSFRGCAERRRELLRLSPGLAMAFCHIPHELLPHLDSCRVAPAAGAELVALAGAGWEARR